MLVGGDEALYTRVKPVLDAIGDKVTWVGGIGCGTVAKLVHNMVSACSRMAIAEGMTLGVKAGVAPEVLARRAVQELVRPDARAQGHDSLTPCSPAPSTT